MPFENDLFILTADKDMECAVKGILSQPGFSSIRCEVRKHQGHDPGCFNHCHEYFRPFLKTHEKAIVVFDRAGSGRERKSREEIEREVEERLSASGWRNRAAAIVIDPELENWVWNNSPAVNRMLGWKNEKTSIRNWLENKNFPFQSNGKPARPKEAFLTVLHDCGIGKSSSIFQELGQKVSLDRCVDPSFLKFKSKLHEWFPAKGKSSKA